MMRVCLVMDDLPQQPDVSAYIVEAEVTSPKTLRDLFIEKILAAPDIEPSIVPAAAAANGMDVIFGEQHSLAISAMEEVAKLVQSQPFGYFGGIALELPVEAQEILTPEALSTLSRDEFVDAMVGLENESRRNTVSDLLDQGLIDGEQAQLVYDASKTIKVTDDYREKRASIYDMAQVAIEYGTPIYAADVDRSRVVFNDLFKLNGYHHGTQLSIEELNENFARGMDDRSDMEYLANMGVDVSAEGKPLIISRGITHLDGVSQLLGVKTEGFDEVLEAQGRSVLTVGIIEKGTRHEPVPDPVDVNMVVGRASDSKLVVGEYKPSLWDRIPF